MGYERKNKKIRRFYLGLQADDFELAPRSVLNGHLAPFIPPADARPIRDRVRHRR
jgi:hypothetical protein